ncbi:MAG: histidine kinase, partial [Azorhizobium sp. 35-67-15]
KFAILIFVGAVAWSMFRGRIGEALMAALFWVIVAVVLAMGYTYRDPLRQVADKVLVQLIPGYVGAGSGPTATVEIARGADGDFAVRAAINDSPVHMLVDTGASSVVLTLEAARSAGLPVDFLKYDVPVDTANGRTKAASVVLDKITIGTIVERRVPALVSPAGVLRTSLLGMSFLQRLDSFEIRGEKLVMRGPLAVR